MRLNVGSGNIPLPGYTNIDKYYYPGSTHPGMNLEDGKIWNTKMYPDSPWLYGDAAKLDFPNETFDEIIMVHVLEHLSMNDGNQAIGEAIRVLKTGGFLEIEVPDLTIACLLLPTVHITQDQNNADWFKIMGLLYGSQGSEGEGQFHLCGYSKEYLRFRMTEHHLDRIEEIPVGFGHGTRIGLGKPEPAYNFRLRGYKK